MLLLNSSFNHLDFVKPTAALMNWVADEVAFFINELIHGMAHNGPKVTKHDSKNRNIDVKDRQLHWRQLNQPLLINIWQYTSALKVSCLNDTFVVAEKQDHRGEGRILQT